MHHIQTNRCEVFHGDDLGDVMRWLDTSTVHWTLASSTRLSAGSDWDFGVGYRGAVELAHNGWDDGMVKIQKGLEALPPPTGHETVTRYDVAGHFPDVARFVAGDPAHMIRRGRVKGAAPVINIVINGRVYSGITGQELMNYGAAMCYVIDKLESSGHRVELDIVFSIKTSAHLMVGWKVKRAQDHLDFNAMAFSLAHPAALRRIAFAMWERTSRAYQESGYGSGQELTADHMMLINAPDNAFVINGVNNARRECRTQAGALAFAAKQINLAAGETLVEVEN